LVSKGTSHENAEVDGNSEDSVIEDATEDYWAGSGSGPDEDDSSHNETREALTHEASDHDAVSHASQLQFASHRGNSRLIPFGSLVPFALPELYLRTRKGIFGNLEKGKESTSDRRLIKSMIEIFKLK